MSVVVLLSLSFYPCPIASVPVLLSLSLFLYLFLHSCLCHASPVPVPVLLFLVCSCPSPHLYFPVHLPLYTSLWSCTCPVFLSVSVSFTLSASPHPCVCPSVLDSTPSSIAIPGSTRFIMTAHPTSVVLYWVPLHSSWLCPTHYYIPQPAVYLTQLQSTTVLWLTTQLAKCLQLHYLQDWTSYIASSYI